jgi:uncharacterized protein YdeI (BOF family)
MNLPPAAVDQIERFLSREATGTIQLDVKDGQVLGLRVTENTRIGRQALADPNDRALKCD